MDPHPTPEPATDTAHRTRSAERTDTNVPAPPAGNPAVPASATPDPAVPDLAVQASATPGPAVPDSAVQASTVPAPAAPDPALPDRSWESPSPAPPAPDPSRGASAPSPTAPGSAPPAPDAAVRPQAAVPPPPSPSGTPWPGPPAPPAPPRSRARRLLAPVGAVAGVVAAFAYVGTVDPNEPGHYPVCPLLRFTGVYCPGCGGLRSAHAFAHGDLPAALGANALAVVGYGVFAVVAVLWLVRAYRGVPARLSVPPDWWWGIGAVLALFTLVRNLPFGSALAP